MILQQGEWRIIGGMATMDYLELLLLLLLLTTVSLRLCCYCSPTIVDGVFAEMRREELKKGRFFSFYCCSTLSLLYTILRTDYQRQECVPTEYAHRLPSPLDVGHG